MHRLVFRYKNINLFIINFVLSIKSSYVYISVTVGLWVVILLPFQMCIDIPIWITKILMNTHIELGFHIGWELTETVLASYSRNCRLIFSSNQYLSYTYLELLLSFLIHFLLGLSTSKPFCIKLVTLLYLSHDHLKSFEINIDTPISYKHLQINPDMLYSSCM